MMTADTYIMKPSVQLGIVLHPSSPHTYSTSDPLSIRHRTATRPPSFHVRGGRLMRVRRGTRFSSPKGCSRGGVAHERSHAAGNRAGGSRTASRVRQVGVSIYTHG